MKETSSRSAKDNSGAAAIEYALIGALLAVALVAAFKQTGKGAEHTFEQVEKSLADKGPKGKKK